MPFGQQQDPYNGMPPPSALNGQTYAIGPDVMVGGINPQKVQQQQQPQQLDMTMTGMLPSATSSGGGSIHHPSIHSQHSQQFYVGGGDMNSMPPQSSLSNERMQSPASMAFGGMLNSAAFEPNSAVDWPTMSNNRFPDPGQEGR
jgi:hypothetical protein